MIRHHPARGEVELYRHDRKAIQPPDPPLPHTLLPTSRRVPPSLLHCTPTHTLPLTSEAAGNRASWWLYMTTAAHLVVVVGEVRAENMGDVCKLPHPPSKRVSHHSGGHSESLPPLPQRRRRDAVSLPAVQ